MKTEFETVILDINVKEIEHKIIALGAKGESEQLQKRRVFDNDPQGHERFRLRQRGNKITLTFKKRTNGTTQEIEIKVDDFDKTYELLSKLPRKNSYYQENKRKIYKLEHTEFSIDTRPLLPPALEIESNNRENVNKMLKLLDLKGKDIGDIGRVKIYKKYNIDLHSYKYLSFEKTKKI